MRPEVGILYEVSGNFLELELVYYVGCPVGFDIFADDLVPSWIRGFSFRREVLSLFFAAFLRTVTLCNLLRLS